jgi:hypothetical protein
MILGLDVGGTIGYKHYEPSSLIGGGLELDGLSWSSVSEGVWTLWPHVEDVLPRLVEKAEATYFVSKVNEEQKARSIKWFDESQFCERMGIPRENVFYCEERKDKGPICKKLGVTHFVDDRPEVMAYLDPAIFKIIFSPQISHLFSWFNMLVNCKVVTNWLQVEGLLKECEHEWVEERFANDRFKRCKKCLILEI